MAAVVAQMNGHLVDLMREAGIADLSTSHGDVLSVLFVEGEATMSELACKIARDPSTITALVHKLKALGYVEVCRAEEDKRVNVVRLTSKGRALEPEFKRISCELYDFQTHALTDEQRQELRALLKQMYCTFRKERE